MSESVFKWATIAGVGPLRVRLDGDAGALAITPDSLVDPTVLRVGDRVRCEIADRRLIVHGANAGGSALTPRQFGIGGATAVYRRIAVIDGLNGDNGAHFMCDVFGGSDYGSSDRHSATVHFVQRGANGVKVEAFRRGATTVRYFSRQINTYVFELWMLATEWGSQGTIWPRESWRATVTVDSATTTAPTSLVEATYYDAAG